MNPHQTRAAPSSSPDVAHATPAPKISFVSLGCPKALVDSERIISRLRAEGYELTKTHQTAEAVIVNTCGFLDSAKAESLLRLARRRRKTARSLLPAAWARSLKQSLRNSPTFGG
jgi:ribosomal protein S12 methylthiotransferase